MKLQAKIAIVTGGSRGIGAATAQLFAENGAKVFIWDVLEEGKQTAEKINESIGKENVHFAKVNITDNESIASALQEVIEKYGRIDILINNAGITRDKSFLKMSYYEWQQVIDVNLTGVFNCTKAVAPYMSAAALAKKLGLGINAGHDLDRNNLPYLIQSIPSIEEVSIGHALMSDALYLGLENTIQLYKRALS